MSKTCGLGYHISFSPLFSPETAADIIFPYIEADLEAFRKESADIFGRIVRFHATHKAQCGHKNKI